MEKIICNRVEKIFRVDHLADVFTSDVDVSYEFGFPLNTNIDTCLFINPLSEIPEELLQNSLPIMLPHMWTKNNVWKETHTDKFQPISISALHNAHIFGGRIGYRDSIYHDSGQLLLTEDFSILNASLGVLDGSDTLPRDLIEYVDDKYYLSFNNVGKSKILSGDYYFIGSIHHHFGHFLVEGLSRLWAIKYIPEDIRENLQYIIYEESIKDYALKVLSKMGITADNIVFAPKHAILERVFVPDVSYKTHHWASHHQSDVYNLLMTSVKADENSGKYIYLSRKNTPDRPLANELELERKLQDLGFDIVSPEQLDIESQLSIMKSAKVVVGPVGSQMYLSSFLTPKTHVVVCAPSNFYLPDDLLLSSIKGTNLSVLIGSAIDLSKPKRNRGWEVNTNQLCTYVASLI
ncbi:glycosyltransferase family 61 protein [Aeromonas media]|uniref:glycosyltransferase family 61 protein n=1 Tax=Aeromonas media TaxID=651 RepID=UPI0002FBC2E4|nr:glycosyltransferase 61 family protein [Aeromonas media]AHX61736.1 hypothetical protein B224_3391 [Aeromonas media WS]